MTRIFSRYIWLINTVESHSGITFEELSRRWMNSSLNEEYREPLSERTFHRHRKEIWEEFGIKIECHKSTNSYFIGEKDDSKLTDIKRWLLKTISEENIISEGASLGDRLQLEEIPNGQEYLNPIISAMKDSRILEMTYQTFWSDESYTTPLQPFFLKVFERRWYVIGITERHPGELRIYALDRITDLNITEKHFHYPKNFDPRGFYNDFFGIFHTAEKPEKIVIKATDNQQRFLRSLPLHHSQREIETGENYALFEYHLVPTYDFIQEILSRTNTIEVLEPQWLRGEMKGLIEKMNENYN